MVLRILHITVTNHTGLRNSLTATFTITLAQFDTCAGDQTISPTEPRYPDVQKQISFQSQTYTTHTQKKRKEKAMSDLALAILCFDFFYVSYRFHFFTLLTVLSLLSHWIYLWYIFLFSAVNSAGDWFVVYRNYACVEALHLPFDGDLVRKKDVRIHQYVDNILLDSFRRACVLDTIVCDTIEDFNCIGGKTSNSTSVHLFIFLKANANRCPIDPIAFNWLFTIILKNELVF